MKQTLKYYFSVAMAFMKLSIQAGLEYPINLLGWGLANPIQWILGFATIKFVVDQFGSLGGWGYESLAFLYGLAVLSHGLSVVLFIQTWYMGNCVIRGEFDQFLLRPMSILFQFLFMDFNLIGITDLIPGFMVFFYGCIKAQLHWSITNLFMIILTIIGGVMIRGAVWIFCGSVSFWTKSTTKFVDFTHELFERTAMYPLTIYPRTVQLFFTFVLPLGWMTFYPTKDILGLQPGKIPVNMAVVTFAIGLFMFMASCVFFRQGMRKYESAGS